MPEEYPFPKPETSEFQDTIHALLASPDRRTVLEYLTAARDSVSVDRLATELAALRNEIPAEDVTRAQRRRSLVGLYHVHLPKLHEGGLVEWDPEASRVAATPLLERLSVTTPGGDGLVDMVFSVREDTR